MMVDRRMVMRVIGDNDDVDVVVVAVTVGLVVLIMIMWDNDDNVGVGNVDGGVAVILSLSLPRQGFFSSAAVIFMQLFSVLKKMIDFEC